MRRALVVAGTEFRAYVHSRSFLIGLLLPPIIGLIGGAVSIASARDAVNSLSPDPLQLAVLDRSGALFGALERGATERNAALDAAGLPGLRLAIQAVDPERAADTEARVRDGERLAFVEIPAAAAHPSSDPLRVRLVAAAPVRFALQRFVEQIARDELRRAAIEHAALPEALRGRLQREVSAVAEPLSDDGDEDIPQVLREMLGAQRGIALTGPLAFVLLMIVTIASTPLLQGILEEKTSRVSEILLSSISPTELVLGKLLGGLAASSIAALMYSGLIIGGIVIGLGIELPLWLLLIFALYLLLAALLWGALFLSIGAACADMKDAQNLLLPLMLMQLLPMLFVQAVFSAPSGTFARLLSFFPPTAGMTMLLRLGLDPKPHAFDVALSLGLLAACAFAAIVVAGRVARVGLLLQGRGASFAEIVRWVRAG